MASLDQEQRRSPVHPVLDRLADDLALLADDLDLHLVLSDHQHLIQHHGVEKNQQNSVQDLLLACKHHLGQQDQAVEHRHRHGDRKAEFLIENQRRYIHASGRCPRTDHHADSRANQEPGKDGRQHRIPGDGRGTKQSFKNTEYERIVKGTDNCRKCKCFAKNRRTRHKHHHIKNADERRDGNPELILGHQCKPRRPAGDEAVWKDKEGHGQGVERISRQHGYYFFHIHNLSLP